MKSESFTNGKTGKHEMISLVAESPDDVFELGQLSKVILAAQKGFTINCQVSLQFSVDNLVKALLKEPEPCPSCS